MSPASAQEFDFDRRDYLRSLISQSCISNVFTCSSAERGYRSSLQILDEKYRVRIYEKHSMDRRVPVNILMAICEGFEIEGLPREYRCAEEWGEYLSEVYEMTERKSVELSIKRQFGEVEGQQLLDRARVLAFEHWPGEMILPENKSDGVKIPVSNDGHFYATAVLDGVEIDMLIDTGASEVLLSADDARKIGVNVGELIYDIPFVTAAGEVSFAKSEVGNFTFSGVRLDNVEVFIARPEGVIDASLLGMSILREFDRVQISQNELIIEP